MMNKLRDRRGASLLMALLLLLLATMVSVVILTAVSSAARHLSRDREAQQNYLTVSSAAELLRSGIKGAKYTRTETVTYTYDYDAEGNVTGSHESEPVIVTTQAEAMGVMGAWLASCIQADGNWQQSERHDTITLTVTTQGTDEVLRPVKVDFSMTDKGEISTNTTAADFTLVFYLPDGDDCRMTLKLTGYRTWSEEWEGSVESGVRRHIMTTSIEWKNDVITKGGEVQEGTA